MTTHHARHLAAVSLTSLLLALGSGSAHAQADAARKEAAERFDRGLRLFDERNLPAALAELERAHALSPNPVVLLNIGLVQASMGRAVQAVATLDRVLAEPGTLSPARLEQARRTRDEHARRIGEITVTTQVTGATIELDGVAVGSSPLSAPLRVASGEHVVSVVATGYAPARRAVSVAGNARVDVALELVAMQGKAGWLAVRAAVPAVEVRVDGELAARTPVPGPLAVAPGKRRVDLRRAGYRAWAREVAIAEGATSELDAQLEEDPSAARGRVRFVTSEPDAQLTVDGAPRGAATAIELPLGVHALKLERAGFLPVERELDVGAAGETVTVTFEPTPETRASYVGRARSRRTWGIVATAVGGAAIAGGAGFLVWNASATSDRRAAYFSVSDSFEPGGRCDRAAGLASAACFAELDAAKSNYDASRSRRVFGWAAVGAGAAAVGVGAYLLVTGDDPARYDRPRVAVTPWPGGAAVVGAF
ncbi:MAG: PEGA domain-containing protein [Polyangiaceae bacterium]|nr:PEGA domain-containing protein [Polyangiaceae bacterium]